MMELQIRIPVWPLVTMTGYEPKTTYWEDFSIADGFGAKEVVDTFDRAFTTDTKSDVEYITELVMVLNWKIHQFYEKQPKLAAVYNRLWAKADSWCMDNLKGDDLDYFLKTTD